MIKSLILCCAHFLGCSNAFNNFIGHDDFGVQNEQSVQYHLWTDYLQSHHYTLASGSKYPLSTKCLLMVPVSLLVIICVLQIILSPADFWPRNYPAFQSWFVLRNVDDPCISYHNCVLLLVYMIVCQTWNFEGSLLGNKISSNEGIVDCRTLGWQMKQINYMDREPSGIMDMIQGEHP